LSFPAIGGIAGRLFLDSRAAAFLGGRARYSRSGAACTWKSDYAVTPRVGIKAARRGAARRSGIEPDHRRNKEILEILARSLARSRVGDSGYVPPLDKLPAASPATRVTLIRRN